MTEKPPLTKGVPGRKVTSTFATRKTVVTEKPPLTEDSLCAWMIDAIAALLQIDPRSLGPASAFEDLGLSSLAAVRLAAELSDAFGIEVDALVAWDYPTIGEVARAVCKRELGSSPSL